MESLTQIFIDVSGFDFDFLVSQVESVLYQWSDILRENPELKGSAEFIRDITSLTVGGVSLLATLIVWEVVEKI